MNTLLSDKQYFKLSPTETTEICTDFFNVGRPNDNVEGFDLILLKAQGLYKKIEGLTVPSAAKTSRILLDQTTTRIKVRVLTDIEPNGADLSSLNSGVPIKRAINVNKIDKGAYRLSSLILVTVMITLLMFF